MNSFYLAKRKLRLAGTLDIVSIISWSFLVFIVTIYHFFYLMGTSYGTLKNGSESSVTTSYVTTFISSSGYAAFFKPTLLNFIVFKITLWTLVFSLFLITLLSFLGKIVLALIALYFFIKASSLGHIRASVAVMFFPLIGGMHAINYYNATTSSLAPRYVASHSLFRCKLKNLWYSLAFGGDNE